MATPQTTTAIVGVTAGPEVRLEDAEGVEEARNHPQGEFVRMAAGLRVNSSNQAVMTTSSLAMLTWPARSMRDFRSRKKVCAK